MGSPAFEIDQPPAGMITAEALVTDEGLLAARVWVIGQLLRTPSKNAKDSLLAVLRGLKDIGEANTYASQSTLAKQLSAQLEALQRQRVTGGSGLLTRSNVPEIDDLGGTKPH